MTSKLVRSVDGYKFYSTAHETKEAALKSAKNGNSPVYMSETKAWYNMNTLRGVVYQEDFGVTPGGVEFN